MDRLKPAMVPTALIADSNGNGPILVRVDEMTASLSPIIRLAFYFYLASIPFEIEDRPIPIEIPTLMGCVFLLTTLFQPGICYRRLPKGFWLVTVFFAVYVISSLVNGFMYPDKILQDFFRLVQLIVLLWASYNVMRDSRIATVAVATIAVAALVRALLQLLGVGVTTNIVGRVQVFGQDQNSSAGIMAAASLILIGLTYARPRTTFQPRMIIWPFVAIFAVAIVQTGSRGALVALVAGLCCFVLSGSGLRQQITTASVVVVAVLAVLSVAASSKVMRERWQHTLKKGDMSKREELFPIFMDMFYEKPLIGWGPYANSKEGGRRLRLRGFRRISPHNLPQEMLTATGLIGTIPMTCALWVCFHLAWKARRGVHGALPLALFAYVVAHNLSLDLLRWKLFWFIIAYACACGSVVLEGQRRIFVRRMGSMSPERSESREAIFQDYARVVSSCEVHQRENIPSAS